MRHKYHVMLEENEHLILPFRLVSLQYFFLQEYTNIFIWENTQSLWELVI